MSSLGPISAGLTCADICRYPASIQKYYCVYDCILYREYLPIKKDLAKKKCVILYIVTHPPDSLPPTILQWCVVLSRSTIGIVILVIAATVVAAAAVASLLPAAQPDW